MAKLSKSLTMGLVSLRIDLEICVSYCAVEVHEKRGILFLNRIIPAGGEGFIKRVVCGESYFLGTSVFEVWEKKHWK